MIPVPAAIVTVDVAEVVALYTENEIDEPVVGINVVSVEVAGNVKVVVTVVVAGLNIITGAILASVKV